MLVQITAMELVKRLGIVERHNYLYQPKENSFYQSLTCNEGVKDIVCFVRTDKTCGPNSTQRRIVKDFEREPSKHKTLMLSVLFSHQMYFQFLRN